MQKKVSQSGMLSETIAEIENIFPSKIPRFDYDGRQKLDVLGVSVTLGYENDSSVYTSIGFLSGHDGCSRSQGNSFFVEDFLNRETITQLISYFFKNSYYLVNITPSPGGFELDFDLPMEHMNDEGISCRRIIFEIEIFYLLRNEKIFIEYLRECVLEIFLSFEKQISNTPTYKKQYGKYTRGVIAQLLEGLEKDDIIRILETMSVDQLKEILGDLPEDLLFELCGKGKSSSVDFIKQLVSGN